MSLITPPEPLFPGDRLHVTAWADPVIDALGLDPRSGYVEQFWLGILGPSTTWLLRRLATGLDAQPAGFDLPLADTARALGLGARGGRHSPFVRSLTRACQFKLAQFCGGEGLAVRRRLPPLTRQQVSRLPAPLQDEHRSWQEAQLRTPDLTQRTRRARGLALSLLELGEDAEAAERQLHRWKFHPALAYDAVRWASDCHQSAGTAESDTPEPDTAGAPGAGTAGTAGIPGAGAERGDPCGCGDGDAA